MTTGPDEWWYITFLVGGEVSLCLLRRTRGWGGRMLVTHRRPDGRYDRFTADAPAAAVRFDTARADLSIGRSSVRQRDGVYHLVARARGTAGDVRLELEVRPLANRYFPAVELRDDDICVGLRRAWSRRYRERPALRRRRLRHGRRRTRLP